MELYFAYGSNLWIGQMRRRCPSARVEALATLKGRRLWFPLRSSRWGGGVAGLREDPLGMVEGVVYRISWDDLKRMDRFESVHTGMYRREEVSVHTRENEVLHAWTYVSRVEDGAPFPTTSRYIGTIIRGAEEHGLSQDWIRFLRDFPVQDPPGSREDTFGEPGR